MADPITKWVKEDKELLKNIELKVFLGDRDGTLTKVELIDQIRNIRLFNYVCRKGTRSIEQAKNELISAYLYKVSDE